MTTGMRCADAEGRRSGTRTFRPYADASAAVLLLRPLCTALLRPSAFGSRSLRSGLPCSQCNQVRLRMRSGDGQRPCVCNAKVIQQSRRALFEADCRAKSHRFVSLFLRPSPETEQLSTAHQKCCAAGSETASGAAMRRCCPGVSRHALNMAS